MAQQNEIVVVGGGPVGIATSLALDGAGFAVTLVTGRAVLRDDGRAAAILEDGLAFLDGCGAGAPIRREGSPLAAIRIIDVTGRLLPAPPVMFRASELGERAFGSSLATQRIVALLMEAARARGTIRLIAANVASASFAHGRPLIATDEGETLSPALAVAADGRKSLLREAASIRTRSWAYPQEGLTFLVRHTRDHEDISTEFHTPEGPLTFVPAGNSLSSVVWMMAPARAERLVAAGPETVAREAETTGHAILGRLVVASGIGRYPMGGVSVDRMTAPGLALVGETAHAFPPIGAQGLNLGLRDARDLAKALVPGRDNTAALLAYDRARRRDAAVTTAGVDTLNRSLLSGFLPVSLARGAAMAAFASLPPLRRLAMTLGMGRTPALPFSAGR
jgi:2-octaprenyl-6-methoxyphenol hydroxylase